jgi:hypothetical protein
MPVHTVGHLVLAGGQWRGQNFGREVATSAPERHPLVPCLRHNPRTIVACSMGSIASGQVIFLPYWINTVQDGDVQFVRAPQQIRGGNFRLRRGKSSSESHDEDALRCARGSS